MGRAADLPVGVSIFTEYGCRVCCVFGVMRHLLQHHSVGRCTCCDARSATIPAPEGTHGYRHAVEVRAGQVGTPIDRTEYRDASTERVEHRISTRTTKDECRSTSEDFCCTESTMGKSERAEGRLDQNWQAPHFS